MNVAEIRELNGIPVGLCQAISFASRLGFILYWGLPNCNDNSQTILFPFPYIHFSSPLFPFCILTAPFFLWPLLFWLCLLFLLFTSFPVLNELPSMITWPNTPTSAGLSFLVHICPFLSPLLSSFALFMLFHFYPLQVELSEAHRKEIKNGYTKYIN